MKRCLLVLVCGLTCVLAPMLAVAAPGDVLRVFKNPNPGAYDRFGASIGVMENTVLIGAPGAYDPSGEVVGAAYLFDGNSGELLQTFRNPGLPGTGSGFGFLTMRAISSPSCGYDYDIGVSLPGIYAVFGILVKIGLGPSIDGHARDPRSPRYPPVLGPL